MAGALSNGRFPLIQRWSCSISRSRFSALIPPETLELFAQTTLRPRPGGGYELCCPPEHEAQIFEFYFGWAMQAPDFLEHLDCPAIAIGSDPTSSHSYMPSIWLELKKDIRPLPADFWVAVIESHLTGPMGPVRTVTPFMILPDAGSPVGT